jgi:hypothetical protein
MPQDHEYPSGHKNPTAKQLKVLAALRDARFEGLTAREFAKIMNPGDESAVNGWGGCFTVLQQERPPRVEYLAERRDNHHVAVLPEFVGDRKTWPGYRHKGYLGPGMVIVREVHCATCTCKEK